MCSSKVWVELKLCTCKSVVKSSTHRLNSFAGHWTSDQRRRCGHSARTQWLRNEKGHLKTQWSIQTHENSIGKRCVSVFYLLHVGIFVYLALSEFFQQYQLGLLQPQLLLQLFNDALPFFRTAFLQPKTHTQIYDQARVHFPNTYRPTHRSRTLHQPCLYLLDRSNLVR